MNAPRRLLRRRSGPPRGVPGLPRGVTGLPGANPDGSAELDDIEREVRGRLLTPTSDSGRRWVIWLVTGLVTALAAAWRLVDLGRPARLVFDETYYVKQAYSLLHLGYEGSWAEEANLNFAAGVFSDLSHQADYVVHPGIGKWMIAAGMAFFDPADPVGWRIAAAITGTLSVALMVLIGRKLFGHIAFGAGAGVLLAVDGIHTVMSRIAILDVFLSFWVLAGFAALLLDRESHRARLAGAAALELHTHGRYRDPWSVRTGFRWWLLVGGICLGLATGVKWSGLYFLAAFGLTAVAWNLSARRAIGTRLWVGAGVVRDGVPAFLTLVPTAALTYLATWIPWFLNPQSYMRSWHESGLLSLWEYHVNMWEFHTSLTSEHTYMSNPLGWLLQLRPTSFAWQTVDGAGAQGLCGDDSCAAAILAVGNPVLWWGAAAALGVVLWAALWRREWRAWAILAGYLGGYAPWLIYSERTVFTFYTVAFVPFVALALTYAIARGIGPPGLARPLETPGTTGATGAPPERRRSGIWVGAGILALAVMFGIYFWPVWSSMWVPHWLWKAHMFLPTWV